MLMSTEFVALDITRAKAEHIVAWVDDYESMSGAGWETEYPEEYQLLLALRDAAKEALVRTHDASDMTGYCSRCGADIDPTHVDEPCSGGAQ